MQPASLIAILTTLLSFTASLRADVIVLYHDNGPGHVRGLFNFDTATHATTFRTSLNTPDQMYAFSRSAQDGSVYAAGGNNNLYRINLDTGATVLIGATGLNGFTDLAIDPVTNTFYAMARSYLYTLNPATAAPTLIDYAREGPNSIQLNGMAFSPQDVLYAFAADLLYTLDPATAHATRAQVPSYQTNFANAMASGMAFSPGGSLYAGDFNSDVFSVNVPSGQSTLLGTTSAASGQHAMIVAIPEPSSLAALALLGMLTLNRSRDARAHPKGEPLTM